MNTFTITAFFFLLLLVIGSSTGVDLMVSLHQPLATDSSSLMWLMVDHRLALVLLEPVHYIRANNSDMTNITSECTVVSFTAVCSESTLRQYLLGNWYW